eukprot:jgi/Mesen1/3022/ME000178S02149
MAGIGCEGRCLDSRLIIEKADTGYASLSDAYKIGEELGRGRVGVVRECFDRATGEKLACKTVLKSSLKSPEDVQGLRNEVAALEELAGHPNIIDLRRVFEDPFGVHLVMEFCEGGDLFDELERRGAPFTEAEAAEVFLQIAFAVEHCHRSGILHRDIKPENVLVKRIYSGSSCSFCSSPRSSCSSSSCSSSRGASAPLAGSPSPYEVHAWCKPGQRQRCRCLLPRLEVKLADFGLATRMDGAGRAAGLAGSPFYVAPEVVLAHSCTSAADMWSLGTLLYSLLSQDLPFMGSSHLADQTHHARTSQVSPVPFSRAPWAAVSHAAKELILLLLHPDPVERPTAGALLAGHPWMSKTWHSASAAPAAASAAAAAPRLAPVLVAVSRRQRVPTPPSSPRTPGSFSGCVSHHKRHKPAALSGLGGSPRGPAAGAAGSTDGSAAFASSPIGPDSPSRPTPCRPSALSPQADARAHGHAQAYAPAHAHTDRPVLSALDRRPRPPASLAAYPGSGGASALETLKMPSMLGRSARAPASLAAPRMDGRAAATLCHSGGRDSSGGGRGSEYGPSSARLSSASFSADEVADEVAELVMEISTTIRRRQVVSSEAAQSFGSCLEEQAESVYVSSYLLGTYSGIIV